MKGKFQLLMLMLLFGLSVPLTAGWAEESKVQYIDAATLKGMLGDPDLVIIDTSQGWWTYDQKIPGSLIFPQEASAWASQIPQDKKIVLYCG